MPQAYSGGRGQYGSYAEFPSDLGGMLEATKGIGENVAGTFEYIQAKRMKDLLMILEGIKSGVVDPNQALVQGTPGGELYKRFFKSEPPAAPSTETTYGQREVMPSPERAEMEPSTYEPTQTTRRTGGFQPQNIEQLKSHIIREELAGRKVDPRLYVIAGLVKSPSQLLAIDPETAKLQARIRNDPKLLDVYAKLRIAYPDEPEENLLKMVGNAAGVLTEGKPSDVTGKPKTPSFAQQKLLAIGQYKNAALDKQAAHWAELEKQGQQKLTLAEQRERNRVNMRVFDVVNKYAPEHAADLAEAINSGEDINSLPIDETIKERIITELAQKRDLTRAKVQSMQTLSSARTQRLELDQQKFQSGIDKFNIMMQYNAHKLQNSDYKAWQGNSMKAIAQAFKDPNRREEASQMLADFIVNELGGDIGDYSTFQGMKESLGRMFGQQGWGTPAVTAPAAPKTGKPFNPPTLKVPSKQGAGKPGTAEDLLKKYQRQ